MLHVNTLMFPDALWKKIFMRHKRGCDPLATPTNSVHLAVCAFASVTNNMLEKQMHVSKTYVFDPSMLTSYPK